MLDWISAEKPCLSGLERVQRLDFGLNICSTTRCICSSRSRLAVFMRTFRLILTQLTTNLTKNHNLDWSRVTCDKFSACPDCAVRAVLASVDRIQNWPGKHWFGLSAPNCGQWTLRNLTRPGSGQRRLVPVTDCTEIDLCGCQFSQEKTKSQSPVCHQKQRSRHTNSMDVKTILTQRGIDTLSTKCDPELTRATHN